MLFMSACNSDMTNRTGHSSFSAMTLSAYILLTTSQDQSDEPHNESL